jgi:hypothetical protein
MEVSVGIVEYTKSNRISSMKLYAKVMSSVSATITRTVLDSHWLLWLLLYLESLESKKPPPESNCLTVGSYVRLDFRAISF